MNTQNLMDWMAGGWKKELGPQDKLAEMFEQGEEEYERTHSVCCDGLLLPGSICGICKDCTVSQKEYDEK